MDETRMAILEIRQRALVDMFAEIEKETMDVGFEIIRDDSWWREKMSKVLGIIYDYKEKVK